MKTALITGATSGIGYELAKLFAKEHYNLVLVSRYKESLVKTGEEMAFLGAPDIAVIAKDLSVRGTAEEIYNETKKHGLEINVLVNDAGVGQHGKFAETELEKYIKIINLNVLSLVEMTYFFMKDMITVNDGKILQLASVASYQPTPLLSVYSATKAFVLSFTDSLINELKGSNVTMTALIPGPTDTDFFRKAEMENTVAAQDTDDAAEVARIGYEALMKGEHHAAGPGVTFEIIKSSVLPNEVVSSKARKLMEPAAISDGSK